VPGPRAYDFLYRIGAPWEGPPRSELVELVRSGRLAPATLPPGRAVDLGCGTGANAIFLADHGFEVTGVDFSKIALQKARILARSKRDRRIRFVQGDLTAASIRGVEGPFDLLVDYGTLDDLKGERRRAMAATVKRLARPGGAFLLWCFYGPFDGLPLISFRRRSRLSGGLDPGEEQTLFGDAFHVERLAKPDPGSGSACFLMTRH
jgi:SAM-dependent methyltransferase